MNKKLTAAITIMVVILGGYMAMANPFKVTDPAESGFNPDKFSFSDYSNKEDLIDAFRKLFPVGTDKAFVDRVLVDAGEATKIPERAALEQEPKYILSPYQEPVNFMRSIKLPHTHNFIYDEHYKVINVQAFGAMKVFEHQPSRLELNEMKTIRKGKQ